ncbi:DegV family protein [Tissierella creatinini]|nr:DegV family protein [Tissierella creatinini]TJX64414.1 DegV family protein [Soehngenia saccharolytica]
MSRIKIITDSTCYISKEYVDKENLAIVPLSYVFDGVSCKEGFKGEFEEFFKKLGSTKLFPTTSQPAVGDFIKAFNEGLMDNDEIIVIVVSSKISGTYNSAMLAKNMLEDKKITIIDSETSVSNLRFLVEDAVDMAKAGKSSEEIRDYINNKKKNTHIYFSTGSLEYLSRSGRLSGVQATLGNLLSIKPIIALKDGKLELIEKVRGTKKALSSILSKIPEDVKMIGICHILNMEEALKIKTQIQEKFPNVLVTIDELGPVIGGHLGPKTFGICIY